jgi:hypothetical protein
VLLEKQWKKDSLKGEFLFPGASRSQPYQSGGRADQDRLDLKNQAANSR